MGLLDQFHQEHSWREWPAVSEMAVHAGDRLAGGSPQHLQRYADYYSRRAEAAVAAATAKLSNGDELLASERRELDKVRRDAEAMAQVMSKAEREAASVGVRTIDGQVIPIGALFGGGRAAPQGLPARPSLWPESWGQRVIQAQGGILTDPSGAVAVPAPAPLARDPERPRWLRELIPGEEALSGRYRVHAPDAAREQRRRGGGGSTQAGQPIRGRAGRRAHADHCPPNRADPASRKPLRQWQIDTFGACAIRPARTLSRRAAARGYAQRHRRTIRVSYGDVGWLGLVQIWASGSPIT
jgi:hypothetical protein